DPNILNNDVFLETVIKDSDLVKAIFEDDHLRLIFVSHPRIMGRFVQDPSFLKHLDKPGGSQSSQPINPSPTAPIPQSTPLSTPSIYVNHQRPQRHHVSNAGIAMGRLPPVEHHQVEAGNMVNVTTLPSTLPTAGDYLEQDVQHHHDRGQPQRRSTTTRSKARKHSPPSSPSSSSGSDDERSNRSNRNHHLHMVEVNRSRTLIYVLYVALRP
ncbi:hypothetical protein FOZ62_011841, partial [Perkinsus olseni]